MYPDNFSTVLSRLPEAKQYLFGLCCAERLLSLYQNFDKRWNENNYPELFSILQIGFNYYSRFDNLNLSANVDDILNNIVRMTPDSDEYAEGIEVIFAQNATFALAYCFDYVISPDLEHIINAGKCVLETIDAIVLEEASEDIDTDPFINQEIALQLQYIDTINNIKSLEELREFNQSNLLIFRQ